MKTKRLIAFALGLAGIVVSACQTGVGLSPDLAGLWDGETDPNIKIINHTDADLVFYHREIAEGRQMGEASALSESVLTGPLNDYFVLRAVRKEDYAARGKNNPELLKEKEVYSALVTTGDKKDDPYELVIDILTAGEGRLRFINELPHVVEVHKDSWSGQIIAYLAPATNQGPSKRLVAVPTGTYELKPVVKVEERVEGILVAIREQQHRQGVDYLEVRAAAQDYRIASDFTPQYENAYLYLNNLSDKGLRLKNGAQILISARGRKVINQSEKWGVYSLPAGAYQNLTLLVGVNEFPLSAFEVKGGDNLRLIVKSDGPLAIRRVDISPIRAEEKQKEAARIAEEQIEKQREAAMIYVEGGTFTMGSPESEEGREDDETQHEVTVSGFYISDHEVTQAEWRAVMGSSPSRFSGDDRPVESISWYEALEYCNRLSTREGLTPVYRDMGDNPTADWSANGYRLPTEAEWEYAARGGNKSQGYRYSGSNSVGSVGWHDDNSGRSTHPVKQKQANELGLHDMSGNVWEWCWDWYGGYSSGSQRDPRGPGSGSSRVDRGGSWGFNASLLRSASRSYNSPGYRYDDIGFRVVRTR